MQPLTYAGGLASRVVKKTTSSTILRSAQFIKQPSSPLLTFSYHTPSQSVSQPASTLKLNNQLVNLAKNAQYDEAYRLHNYLLENKIPINHHFVYEKAALAGVELGRTFEGLGKFVVWFSLVPDRDELPPNLASQRQHLYSATRFSLLRCGNPRAYLRYIMVFGNIMAAKGYTLDSFLEVARVVVKFGRRDLIPSYFKDLEDATAHYYLEQEPEEGGFVVRWFWEAVVKLYVEKGWLDLAFEAVVEKDGKLVLSEELYKTLFRKLQGSGRKNTKKAYVLQDLRARSKKPSN